MNLELYLCSDWQVACWNSFLLNLKRIGGFHRGGSKTSIYKFWSCESSCHLAFFKISLQMLLSTSLSTEGERQPVNHILTSSPKFASSNYDGKLLFLHNFLKYFSAMYYIPFFQLNTQSMYIHATHQLAYNSWPANFNITPILC